MWRGITCHFTEPGTNGLTQVLQNFNCVKAKRRVRPVVWCQAGQSFYQLPGQNLSNDENSQELYSKYYTAIHCKQVRKEDSHTWNNDESITLGTIQDGSINLNLFQVGQKKAPKVENSCLLDASMQHKDGASGEWPHLTEKDYLHWTSAASLGLHTKGMGQGRVLQAWRCVWTRDAHHQGGIIQGNLLQPEYKESTDTSAPAVIKPA